MAARPPGGGVRGNRALTSLLGLLLLSLLALQVASAVWFALLSYNLPVPGGPVFGVVRPVHFFVGFLLFPLIALKTASTGYPFTGAITRRALLGAGAAAGLTLAVGAAQWPSPVVAFLAPRRAGPAPLDLPVMNYEGGGQRVDVGRWRLVVGGTVTAPISLDEAALLALAAEEHRYSIDCVTGWTATRTWRGVPLARLLAMAGAVSDFTHVQVRSASGYHWDHRREDVLRRGALLVTHVDGVRLSDDHGNPARLMIPGVTGQSNVKWVDGLIVGRGAAEDYTVAHLRWGNQPVSGYFLPRDPAGRRP